MGSAARSGQRMRGDYLASAPATYPAENPKSRQGDYSFSSEVLAPVVGTELTPTRKER
jgi:hypothetical protein